MSREDPAMRPTRDISLLGAPLVAALLAASLSVAALADGLPKAPPEQVGLSAERLGRLTQTVREDVAKGRIAGAVMLIARKGKVAYLESFGLRDKDANAPMGKDAIFRVASMTKPVTSVAAMMLVEEGKIALDDPVAKYLPQLGKLKVGVEKTDASAAVTLELVSANREMTVQDLLRHTSGLTYGIFGTGKVKELYKEANADTVDQTVAELVERLGKLPLVYQPGTVWEYSRATDVLGGLVEVVSGVKLSEFFEQRIFKPLKMNDSGFWVPADKLNRLAEGQPEPPNNQKPNMIDVTKPPKFEGGGQGLVTTAEDYARFLQMLLNGGELDGVRILGRKTVEYMTANHLGPSIKAEGAWYLPGPGHGFGLGFAVRQTTGVSPLPGTVGDYAWGGLYGTYFWVDPKEKLFAVWLTQSPANRTYYRPLIRSFVLGSIVDPANGD
jgi:CubicO group peptidase (beta-lactamase class C family)